VRHGITEYNKARRFTGHSDVDLSATGYGQVERLRDRLVDEKIDAVYSSDLKRALVTAELIFPGHDADIVTCPELREISYGQVEGLTFDEIGRLYPEVAQACADLSPGLEFPGGESFEGFIQRTLKFLDKLKGHTPAQTILIASHSGPLRTLICHLLDIDMSHWWQFNFDFASLTIVETYPRGAILNLLNDTSHLKGVGE